MHKKGRETIRAPGLFIFPQGDLEKGGWWTKNILKATEPFISDPFIVYGYLGIHFCVYGFIWLICGFFLSNQERPMLKKIPWGRRPLNL
jgi:hypothetical protein